MHRCNERKNPYFSELKCTSNRLGWLTEIHYLHIKGKTEPKKKNPSVSN